MDNLSRKGGKQNLKWLLSEGFPFEFHEADIRDFASVESIVQKGQFDVILHLAAQVAVTLSVTDPRSDFEINLLGALNVLEAARNHSPHSHLLYSSTNKVYGEMHDFPVEQKNNRYSYVNLPKGVSETHPLDFHSPYGCSKGGADQYFIDYSRIYGMKTSVFRQSCIYGPRQFGVEDQGWVAWFTIAAVLNKPLTIFGDGMQIRDVLHVDDLVRVYQAAIEQPKQSNGQAFNIGGGHEHTLSLLELISLLEKKLKKKIPLQFDQWRPGDQKVFIGDISKAQKILNWNALKSAEQGVGELIDWVSNNAGLFKDDGFFIKKVA